MEIVSNVTGHAIAFADNFIARFKTDTGVIDAYIFEGKLRLRTDDGYIDVVKGLNVGEVYIVTDQRFTKKEQP